MKKINYLIMLTLSVFLFSACGDGCQNDEASSKDDACKDDEKKETAAPNTLTESEKEEGWKLLFDGESVEHWKGYCKDSFPSSGWKVVDGKLQVIGSGKGEAGHGGDIITKNKYENFEFSVEWKVEEGGNSGIFYLAQEKCGEDGQPIWKSAPEMQILDNDKHPDAKLGENGNRQAGALYDLIPAEPQTFKGANKWNKAKVMVYQGTVVHYLNGEKVLEYHLWTDDWKEMVKDSKFKKYDDFLNPAKEGHIGLQDHGNNVWFRNIKIKEL